VPGCAVSANLPGLFGSGWFITGTAFAAEPLLLLPTFEEPPIFDAALFAEDPALLLLVVFGAATPFLIAPLALVCAFTPVWLVGDIPALPTLDAVPAGVLGLPKFNRRDCSDGVRAPLRVWLGAALVLMRGAPRFHRQVPELQAE
jgi:hypothetical protein